MRRTLVFLLLTVATVGFVLLAGSLEPPGPPAPTMVTLQEIYDACTGGGVRGVPKTGQTGCWNESGTPIACAGTGQDGEYQTGVTVDPRFADNGDGTVTDNLTGLIWLENASCFGLRNWTSALSDASTVSDGVCGLTDGSVAGAWRLPNLRELQSLIDYGQNAPTLPAGHPFSGVQSNGYWSSTSTTSGVNGPSDAWALNLDDGDTDYRNKTFAFYVWPVKGGQ